MAAGGFHHHKNCAELYKSGERANGVYTIDPDGTGPFDVFCDQTTAGGGWIVFQKRLDGSVDFYRGWTDYKVGFGNLKGEFWLGLDKINRLTKTGNRLRVELEDTTGKAVYAEYDMFAVTSERTKYKLSLGTYSGKSNFEVKCSFLPTIGDNSVEPVWLNGGIFRRAKQPDPFPPPLHLKLGLVLYCLLQVANEQRNGIQKRGW